MATKEQAARRDWREIRQRSSSHTGQVPPRRQPSQQAPGTGAVDRALDRATREASAPAPKSPARGREPSAREAKFLARLDRILRSR